MKILFRLLGLLGMSHGLYAGVIYGVDKIENHYQHVHYPAYVQIGSFSTLRAAQHLQHQFPTDASVPMRVQSAKGLYRVRIGPFRNPSALKAFARKKNYLDRQPRFRQIPSHGSPIPASRVTSIPTLPLRAPLKNKPVIANPPPSSIYPAHQGSHPEWSVFLGGSYLPNTLKGQTLQLLPYEIGPYADTFTHQSSASGFTWGIDALYRFKLLSPAISNTFIDSLGAGVDLFQIPSVSQTGKVLQFNLPEFENYTYALKLDTVRVMANFDMDFHPIQQAFIPFIQAGIGGARTTVSYHSAPITPVVSPHFILPDQTSWKLAYQAGAGIKYATNTHFVVSLRYLYANMGKIHSSIAGNTATLATPLTVKLDAQNFLFGLTYVME